MTSTSLHPHLSKREIEALGYIADGYTSGQAALRMKIKLSTVRFYIKRARTKLGAPNLASAVKRAIALGLILATYPEIPSEVDGVEMYICEENNGQQ